LPHLPVRIHVSTLRSPPVIGGARETLGASTCVCAAGGCVMVTTEVNKQHDRLLLVSCLSVLVNFTYSPITFTSVNVHVLIMMYYNTTPHVTLLLSKLNCFIVPSFVEQVPAFCDPAATLPVPSDLSVSSSLSLHTLNNLRHSRCLCHTRPILEPGQVRMCSCLCV
jgi:hypothetical protein